MKLTFIIFLCTCIFALYTQALYYNGKNGVLDSTGSYFFWYADNLGYGYSINTCQNQGGLVVSVRALADIDIIRAYRPSKNVWISLFCNGNIQQWQSLGGTGWLPAAALPYWPSVPSCGNTNICTVIRTDGLLVTTSCSWENPQNIVCEVPYTAPTGSPTMTPTNAPSLSPTGVPTMTPTNSPTGSPIKSPSVSPSQSPTTSPTTQPTVPPSAAPSLSPTLAPTMETKMVMAINSRSNQSIRISEILADSLPSLGITMGHFSSMNNLQTTYTSAYMSSIKGSNTIDLCFDNDLQTYCETEDGIGQSITLGFSKVVSQLSFLGIPLEGDYSLSVALPSGLLLFNSTLNSTSSTITVTVPSSPSTSTGSGSSVSLNGFLWYIVSGALVLLIISAVAFNVFRKRKSDSSVVPDQVTKLVAAQAAHDGPIEIVTADEADPSTVLQNTNIDDVQCEEWQECESDMYGTKYWYNPITKVSVWEDPSQKQVTNDVWVSSFSEKFQREFWFNEVTGVSVWEHPLKQ